MNRIYCPLVILLFSLKVFAQQGVVKGVLVDTLAQLPVSNATITVLQKKDSSLVSFTMSDNKGGFRLSGIAPGEYRLLISHISYHQIVKMFRIAGDHPEIDFGNIFMKDITRILEEVTVTNEAPPVTLVGDTVQYNAASFKVQPNASVEELLKKLPGVKVDKDGTVKAQGEKVSRVLVDGKEFFGNDPKIATKNLPADAIDKVQVYDRLSDQAQLTGFDDGNSEKTINLKLKRDKKKGYFGKINGGGGSDDRYQGKFNASSFKGARQLSVIGMANNTNTDGFSIMDILNFTGELKRMMSGGGGNISISINNDDPNAALAGLSSNSGINTIWGGGINYNNLIGTKTDFTSNYFYNRFNPDRESHTQRHYFLPDSSYLYNQDAYSSNVNNSHRLNLSADFQIDSFTSVKISPSLSVQHTKNRSNASYATMSENFIRGSDGYSDNLSESDGYNFRTDLLFRKKFRKRGRTISLNLQSTLNNSDGNSNLTALNNFYDKAGVNYRQDTIRQQSVTESDLKGYTARAVYTEPLFKRSLLEFSVGKGNTNSESVKTTHKFNPVSGKFDNLEPLFSNNYRNRYDYTNSGLRLRRQTKKYNYAAGLSWQQSELEGNIISNNKDSVIRKTFTNLLPNARFQYYFTRFKHLQVTYSSFTNQPTAAQLAPVPDNSDPLNISRGNPDLKPEYTQALQTSLLLVNPYKNRNLFAFFTLQQTQHKIVNDDRVDSMGIKTTKPVNTNGVYALTGDLNWSFPLRFLKANLSIGSSLSYYKGKQFINAFSNKINALSLGPTLRLDINADENLQLAVTANLNYNNTKYSLQPSFNTTYFSQQFGTEIDWQLPARILLSTDFNYTVNSQRATGYNTRVPLWNAGISRQLLRFNRGEIKLRVNDLLNKNIAVNRSTNQNYIEDSRVLTLRRYFLLSFTYSLTKTGLSRESSGGMKIIRR